MAYQPVTKKKEGGGYQPVTKKTPTLNSFLPTLERIKQLPIISEEEKIMASLKNKPATLTAAPPKKVSPLEALVSKLPRGLSEPLMSAARGARKLFAPTQSELMTQALEEDDTRSQEQLLQRAKELGTQQGIIPTGTGDTVNLGFVDVAPVASIKNIIRKLAGETSESAIRRTLPEVLGKTKLQTTQAEQLIKRIAETQDEAEVSRLIKEATTPVTPGAPGKKKVAESLTPDVKPTTFVYKDRYLPLGDLGTGKKMTEENRSVTGEIVEETDDKVKIKWVNNPGTRLEQNLIQTLDKKDIISDSRKAIPSTPATPAKPTKQPSEFIKARLATEPAPTGLDARRATQEELGGLEMEKAVLTETLRNSPASKLVSRMGRGDNTLAQLQENAIKRGGKTTRYDDLDELGFKDMDDAQRAVEQYRTTRTRLNEIETQLKDIKARDKAAAKAEKAELASLDQYAGQVDSMELPITKTPTPTKTSSTPKKKYTPVTRKKKAVTPALAQPTKKDLPTLPKLSPEVVRRIETDLDSKTVNEAIKTRYKNAAGRPRVPDNKLAAAAKIDGSGDSALKNVVKVTGELLTPISSRLARINESLATALRKMEFGTAQGTSNDMRRAIPLMRGTKKMSLGDQQIFSLARLNGDREVYEALARKYDLVDELKEAEALLKDIRLRANRVGMEIPERENYFPRVIKNPKKYVAWWRSQKEWGDINRIIEEEARKKGIKVTDLWKDEEKVARIINNYVRGYGNKTALAAPSFAKGRTVNVLDDELAEFYDSADNALTTYIIRMNDEIEARKFFGKKGDGDVELEDSIGHYVMELVADGKIKPEQQEEVANIFRARFKRGSMNGALDLYRNMEYISTMGNPISAITQIGDFAWSLYENGWWNTAKGLLSRKKLSREDLGFDAAIMNEFTRDTWSGKAVDATFKAVGLDRLARLGQETFINANLSKLTTQAKKGDKALITELNRVFDPQEARQALEELSKGEITERTKFMLFNRILDFQPLAKSEMPEVYLNSPNGRLFYMLKTFTIKQYDIARREAIDKIQTGKAKEVATGMKNLIHIAALFMMANATADEIKDLVLDRDTPPSDRLIDNLWRLAGASKYDVYKAREEGVGATVLKKILFPSSIIDRGYKDAMNFIEEKEYTRGDLAGEEYKLESTQTIPFAGKLYYWWFGRGEQKERYKESLEPEESTTALPELPPLPELPKLPKI